MTANTRANRRLATSIGRVTPRRALLALGVVTAVTIPGGLALAATRDDAVTTTSRDGSAAVVAAIDAASTLSDADVANLVYMRQEEKLAADVYALLADTWGLRVFENIQRAEVTHQTEVEALMALHGIDDPVAGLAAGEFVDPELQALYDDLVERGSTSATEALRVGALIEELDIQDLQTRASDDATIDALYARLEQGSENHLRAFVRNLDQNGVDYEPVLLDQASFDTILADTSGGHGQGGGSSHGAGRGQSGGHGLGSGQGHGAGRAQGGGQWPGAGRGMANV